MLFFVVQQIILGFSAQVYKFYWESICTVFIQKEEKKNPHFYNKHLSCFSYLKLLLHL